MPPWNPQTYSDCLIALATVVEAAALCMIFKLEKGQQKRSERVDLVLLWQHPVGPAAVATTTPLRILSASRNGCVVERVELTGVAVGGRNFKLPVEVSGVPIVGPFSEIQVGLSEAFHQVTIATGAAPSVRTSVQFRFMAHCVATGRTFTAQSHEYSGVLWMGDIREVSDL